MDSASVARRLRDGRRPSREDGVSEGRRSCPTCGSTFAAHLAHCALDGTALLEPGPDPLIGRTVDRYRIDAWVGDGGMSRVYRARHTFLNKDVALKVLFGELAADAKLTTRFRREAETAGRIKHPNVVQILDFGKTDEGLAFMVMELVDGLSLSRELWERPRHSLAWIADITRQIALGLEAAHAAGFVHRDLKPGNVMLETIEGRRTARILDFGLVKQHEEDDEKNKLTRTGQILGTPSYMAPEQISGADVDARADLYALGVILYEMIAGKTPFSGSTSHVLTQHVTQPPPPLPDAGGLERIALKLLAKKPSGRPDSARAVVESIDAVLGALGEAATRRLPSAVARVPTGASGPTEEARPSSEPGAPSSGGLGVDLTHEPSAVIGDHPSISGGVEVPFDAKAAVAEATRGKRWLGALVVLGLLGGAGAYAWHHLAPTAAPPPPVPEAPPVEPAPDPSPSPPVAVEPEPEPVPEPELEPPPSRPRRTPKPRPTSPRPSRPSPPTSPPPAPPAPRPTSPSAGGDDALDRALDRVTGDDPGPGPSAGPGDEEADAALERARAAAAAAAARGDALSPQELAARRKEEAIAALARRDLAAAEVALRRCTAELPSYADCHKLLGVAAEQRGRKLEAAEHYQRYLDLSPTDARDRAAMKRTIARLREGAP
jgi:serine/threonine protein kinase